MITLCVCFKSGDLEHSRWTQAQNSLIVVIVFEESYLMRLVLVIGVGSGAL